jgi:hypothetical protein
MRNIIGFAGRKQSGKNTSCNFIIGHSMHSLGICKEFKVTTKGQLWISDIFGDLEGQGVFDITRKSPEMEKFLENHLNEYIKLYSFADALKQKVCIDVLGLTHEQCFGTDEDKNSATHLKWEDMPGVTTEKTPQDVVDKEVAGRLGKYYEKILGGMVYHAPGIMTAREVMQFVGTEIFRKMYANVWVDACLRQIEKDNPVIALICDVRFPNEADGILAIEGGTIMKFTRCVNPNDKHESETALDNYTKIPYVIDNSKMSVIEQNEKVYSILQELGLIIE